MSSRCQRELFDREFLATRLQAFGLSGVSRLELHENRSVMINVTSAGVLRIHRAYAFAPDDVLRSVVGFLRPGIRRARRRELERTILAFPVHGFVSSPRPRPERRMRPEDRPRIQRLSRRHRTLNLQHFDGTLARIRFRISRRMRRRLGELTLDGNDRPMEIAVALRHIERDGWDEVDHTLLHEMIHQWQAETGRPVDHGTTFRRKARDVGVVPRAMRHVRPPR